METFTVEGMTCGHCVSTVTKAVHDVDPAARVSADLATRKVDIESEVGRDQLVSAIEKAGYPVIERNIPTTQAE